jgi:transposase
MKYRFKLSEKEREALRRKVSSGLAPAREIMHAYVLLKIDQGLTDKAAAEGVGVDPRTVQRIREKCSKYGVEAALTRKAQPPRPSKRKLTDEVEARLIAVACSTPPDGRSRWTLRLLADKAVELEIVSGEISHESIRQTLKKMNCVLTESKGG